MKHLILTLITAGILALAAPVTAQDENSKEEMNLLSGCLDLCIGGTETLQSNNFVKDETISNFIDACAKSCINRQAPSMSDMPQFGGMPQPSGLACGICCIFHVDRSYRSCRPCCF